MATKPIKRVRVKGIEVSIWQNDTDQNKRFYSASIKKSWKDEKDLDEKTGKAKWKESETLFVSEYELPDLIIALQKVSLELIEVQNVK